ncbi:ATP-binding protein [Thermopolyspora sp. NPDC052614]|uniref:ATP-binding protein n=1 Tax=Thermopolyspora sp. NPDC052614 TaxID=3155682 RepID=UPI00341663C3
MTRPPFGPSSDRPLVPLSGPSLGAAHASSGRCAVWPLPPDPSCAAAARTRVRRALREMGLADEVVSDATLAVSELVSNAYLHVIGGRHGARGPGGRTDLELWLYRRGRAESSQVVCKVFDTCRDHAPPPSRGPLTENAGEHGRGLGIVDAVVAEWGCHLTRSRLGEGRAVPGKVVWFAVPAPPEPRVSPGVPAVDRLTAAQAAYAIQDQLAARGILRAIRWHDHHLALVPLHPRVTVYCGDGAFTWSHDGVPARLPYTDLIDAGERLVRLHEELAVDAADAPPRRAGADGGIGGLMGLGRPGHTPEPSGT